MFPMSSMFGMVDSKFIRDACNDNEEYLGSIIKKIPVLGKEYIRDKEIIKNNGEIPEGPENSETVEVVQRKRGNSFGEKLKKGWGKIFGGDKSGDKSLIRNDKYAVVMSTEKAETLVTEPIAA